MHKMSTADRKANFAKMIAAKNGKTKGKMPKAKNSDVDETDDEEVNDNDTDVDTPPWAKNKKTKKKSSNLSHGDEMLNETLQHYGIPGMKWKQRRAIRKAGGRKELRSIKRDYKIAKLNAKAGKQIFKAAKSKKKLAKMKYKNAKANYSNRRSYENKLALKEAKWEKKAAKANFKASKASKKSVKINRKQAKDTARARGEELIKKYNLEVKPAAKTANKVTKQSALLTDQTLQHHGVQGMKWGKHKAGSSKAAAKPAKLAKPAKPPKAAKKPKAPKAPKAPKPAPQPRPARPLSRRQQIKANRAFDQQRNDSFRKAYENRDKLSTRALKNKLERQRLEQQFDEVSSKPYKEAKARRLKKFKMAAQIAATLPYGDLAKASKNPRTKQILTQLDALSKVTNAVAKAS